MADKNISMLNQIESLDDDSLLVVEQGGKAGKLTGKQFREFAEAAGEAAVKPYSNSEVKPYALAAQSYAMGGTGTREGENTANAWYYMEQARLAAGVIPTLTDAQRSALFNLMKKYLDNATYFIYDNDVSRNAFAPIVGNSPYDPDHENKIMINCSLFPQLVWAGIDPDSFIGKQGTYDGTNLIKAFDWGWQFTFPNRFAYGVTRGNQGMDGELIGYVEAGENSYSCNTYYSESASRDDKQQFKGYIYGSDMAQEAYIRGFEIPMHCAQAGDMIFYRASSLHDGFQDGNQTKAFRNLGHVAMVYSTTYKASDAILTIIECTDFFQSPITTVYQKASSPAYVVRAADLADRACMCIRHPAAFGVMSNVEDRFAIIYRGMNQPV